jgi:hypothetical protein
VNSADGYEVDAALLGNAFALDPSIVPEMIRTGEMTGHHEKGVGDDTGRHCLSFSHAGRTLRIILDSNGAILSQTIFRTLLTPAHKVGSGKTAG